MGQHIYGKITAYSPEQKCGTIISLQDEWEEYPYDDDENDMFIAPRYHFQISDVRMVEGTQLTPGMFVVFDSQDTDTETLHAVNVHVASVDDIAAIESQCTGYIRPHSPVTIHQRQTDPQYQQRVTDCLEEYLTSAKPSISKSELGKITSVLSNVLLASINLGGSLIQAKAQKQILTLRELSNDYKISLTSILKYLEKCQMIEKEQSSLFCKFYMEYCTDMTPSEKREFMAMEHRYKIITTALKAGGYVLSAGVVSGTIIAVSKIWSPSYQKTERYRIKHEK